MANANLPSSWIKAGAETAAGRNRIVAGFGRAGAFYGDGVRRIASRRHDMVLLRAYLLAGLLTHKLVWELLKRRSRTDREPNPEISVRLMKGLKLGILLGIVIQTLVPLDVFPIARVPTLLRVIGVVIYTLGLLTAICGRLQLGDNWSDIESPEVKGGADVVSWGLYRYIRHPIYLGDLMLLYGLELCLNSWFVLAVLVLTPVVLCRAICEEKMLLGHLPGYDSYLRRTKRFIPFVV